MDEWKIDELVTCLTDMAFKGERRATDIRENISHELLRFSVRHKMTYGNEQMFYDLRFRRNHQFDAYQLKDIRQLIVSRLKYPTDC